MNKENINKEDKIKEAKDLLESIFNLVKEEDFNIFIHFSPYNTLEEEIKNESKHNGLTASYASSEFLNNMIQGLIENRLKKMLENFISENNKDERVLM